MTDATIISFIDQSKPTGFSELAKKLAARQLQDGLLNEEPLWSGLSPESLDSWREIPPNPAIVHLRSNRSTASDDLSSHALDAYWKLLAPAAGSAVLILGEATTDAPGERLLQAIRQATPSDELTHPVSKGTVDTLAVRSWLAGRQRGGRPVTIATTASLIGRLGSFLERRRLLFRLPPGSELIVLDAPSELQKAAPILPALIKRLGLAQGAVRYLVVLPTLTTPLLGVPDHRENSVALRPPPHWARYRLVEDQLVMMDLATTRLPACQKTGLRARQANGEPEALTLQL